MFSAWSGRFPSPTSCHPVTSKKFKDGAERAERPLGSELLVDTVFGFARYGLWLVVTDISTFIMFQQSFTYYVSNH